MALKVKDSLPVCSKLNQLHGARTILEREG